MKVKIAYIDEPPFYWTGSDKKVTGADIELAEVVLRAIGATSIEYCHKSAQKISWFKRPSCPHGKIRNYKV